MPDMIELIAPSVPALRRYARALLRDRAGADDLVQECLTHAIDRWEQRRGQGDPRSWLFSILHNLAVSQLRQQRRRGRHLSLDDAPQHATLVRAASQEHGVQYTELLRGVAELSEEHRAVLLLVSVEDMSYAEAARILDVPIGTVMSRLSRARQTLARALDSQAPLEARRPVLRRLK